jgi:tetratricopeptide (TPR) repeat protein
LSYFLRHVTRILGVLLLLAAVMVVKVTYNARQEFTIGEEAYTRGAYDVAITHYERAIKWYTPFSNTIRHAVERLRQLGTEAEARGDRHLALAAYQSLRASLYAVQSFYIPYQSWIPKTEERIAPLLAKIKAGEEPNEDKLRQDTARFAMQLQRHVGPHLGWSVLVEIGFLGWVGATVGLIWYVVDKAGNFARRQGLLWGSLIAVFFALWLIGMRLT